MLQVTYLTMTDLSLIISSVLKRESLSTLSKRGSVSELLLLGFYFFSVSFNATPNKRGKPITQPSMIGMWVLIGLTAGCKSSTLSIISLSSKSYTLDLRSRFT